MIRKLAVVGVVVTAVVALTAGAAFAHVEIEREGEVTAAGVVNATVSVPNEKSDAATTTVELVFPDSPTLKDAEAATVGSWTATVEKDDEGDVESITWTGGEITGDDEAEFPITIGDVPDDVEQIDFRAVQTYDDGDVVRWIEATPEGGEEPEHPAPILAVRGEVEDGHGHDDGLSTGAIIAIVIGAILVIALIVVLIGRSRRAKASAA
jgi:uncharacterized protein YcnI